VTSETAARTRRSHRSEGGDDGGDTSARAWWRPAARWESGLVLVLICVIVFGASESSTFLGTSTVFYLGINIGYIAIMALPLTLIVMTGEIDLSVASMLGLSGAVAGDLWHHGAPIGLAIVAALAVGALGGALNGILVAKFGLPSIAVTIGTLTLFRGLAEILLGSLTVPAAGDRQLPTSLTDIGVAPIPGTQLSYTMLIFLVLAVGCGVLLHATPLGRAMHAIGLQPEAARFSGIRVDRVKFWLYVSSGVVCAFSGILLTLQNSSVSYSAGTGLELNVVAIVLFGGVSIFGGRGTIVGVVLSVAVFGALQMALTQINVQPEIQNIITGALLLISVVVPNGGEAIRRLRVRFKRSSAAGAPRSTTNRTPGSDPG
jgi:rhamnose transport system permease protein